MIIESELVVTVYQARYLRGPNPDQWRTIALVGYHFTLPHGFDAITDVREEGLRSHAEIRSITVNLHRLLSNNLGALLKEARPFVTSHVEYSTDQEAELLERRVEAEKEKMLRNFYDECWKAISQYARTDSSDLWDAIKSLPVEYIVGDWPYGYCGWVQFTDATRAMLREFKAGVIERAKRGGR